MGTQHFIVADKQGTIQILQLKQEGKDAKLALSCVYASEDNSAAVKRPIVSLCYEGKINTNGDFEYSAICPYLNQRQGIQLQRIFCHTRTCLCYFNYTFH